MLPEENCLRVVVGAKLDLVTSDAMRAVTKQEGRAFASEINSHFLEKRKDVELPFFETSSKTGECVTQAFEYIFEHCLSAISDEYRIKNKSGTIDIRNSDSNGVTHATSQSPKKCCLQK